jgi:transcriptional regulator with XRE-family HTH domain
MGRCDSAYGKRIKKRLIDLNMTQVELARQLGISKQYMSRIISGDRSGNTYRERIEEILNNSVA